ncbi:DUF1028 domain-containing protein [Chitinophaga sp. Mgbs1]|uniref:DUF1028 domain-containing protein n=1 Tax=Chitinophaga solisilvae TaxID=1233460 RepID=A0A9Q5D5V2_9BACT|nr:DUF1028 domain-containing protein [Chitinophaga solisilvae]
MGYDSLRQEWGIAVATNNICVGNSTIYIAPGTGAIAVIAETEPAYALNGLQQLRQGYSMAEAIHFTREKDPEAHYRQAGGVDANGNAYAFTGQALQYWKGKAGHRTGKYYVVMGNQLADSVLSAMASAFEQTSGTLAERLLKSLIAGQQAGGQINGKQSAALTVKGTRNEWYNQIDLRVDNAADPFKELQQLLSWHYGRIRLNQAIFQLKKGNMAAGEKLLQQGIHLTAGWNGIYGKIALAWLLAGKEAEAAAIIRQALLENPQWKENLPAFYCLYHRPEIRAVTDTCTYSEKDWNSAVHILSETGRHTAAISLARQTLKKYPSSSATWYQAAYATCKAGDQKTTRHYLQKALELDPENTEALALLGSLK